MNIAAKLLSFPKVLFSTKKKTIISLVVLGLVGLIGFKVYSGRSKAPQYETAQVEKGTLVESVSASGNISTGNSIDITTQASGIVNTVEVKNGDTVTAGEELATLTLDQSAQQKLAQAQASFLQAKTSLDSANANLNTLQNTEFTTNQKLINDAVARGLSTTDPTYIEENAAWLAAEANYKNQQTVIAQAQTALSAAALSLSQISPTITAPASGLVTDLTLTPGLPVGQSTTGSSNSSSNSNTSSASSQKLGTVTMQGPLQATVNLSEVDVIKVSPGQKVTLTLDAFPNQTFTGIVATVDTNGTVSSGVTSYPATINLNTTNNQIYPNMSADASIITKVKDNVLLVPSAAVQTQGGQSFVRELQNGQLIQIPVQTGDSNDTDTEITSGLNEGDTIVTSIITTGSSTGTSPFGGGGFRFGGGGGGGGALRPGGFGGGGRGG